MSQLLPRFRRQEIAREQRLAGGHLRPVPACPTRKHRYGSESQALEALARVRDDRRRAGETRAYECRIYFCDRCEGWHLTSNEAHPEEFTNEPEHRDGETWQKYAQRLEKRIARQRAEILSLHQLGHGVSNKTTRRRIETLVIALGRATERFERERRHRIALVELLDQRCRCWWCRLTRWVRHLLRKPGACEPEAVAATGSAEES